MRTLALYALVAQLTQGARVAKKTRTLSFLPSAQTEHGCTCASNCAAKQDDGYGCDFCDASKCGSDHCVFSPEQSWESQSHQQKVEYFEKKIRDNPVRNPLSLTPQESFAMMAKLSVRTTFDNFLPEMPAGRVRVIHPRAVMCKVQLDIKWPSPYTGLLGFGKHEGFVRMGPGGGVDPNVGFTPGVGWKFPRSGIPSGDFVSMHSTAPGQGFNFFARNMSNHVPPSTSGSPLVAKFQTATICTSFIGLSNFAQYSKSGRKVSTPKFPFKLFFSPTDEVQQSSEPKTLDGLLSELESIPMGATLFKVYACDETSEHETEGAASLERNCGAHRFLGYVRTTGQCLASDYGDQSLHIRHTRIEEDWDFKPEYKKAAQAPCGRTDEDWAKGSPPRCSGAYSMLNDDA